MPMNNKLYRIGQLSKKAELPISTLNHYLNLKLIKPEKVIGSGYRLFSNKTLETILEIQKLKKEYLPLSVIKQQLRKGRELLIKEPSAQYRQLTLPTFEPEYPPITFQFPSTRFQGSKLKLVEWIWQNCKHLDFNSVLDAFGGTACVSYLFKTRGKQVFYNDYLKSNYYIGLALIENSRETLTQEDVEEILKRHPEMKYPTFIQETFKGIYFTDEENEWLDVVVTNIDTLITNIYKKAIAYFALFQSCVIKRPYNLFHRKNLYMRTAKVKRSFGNKITWDTPFPVHFVRFVEQANESIFDNGQKNKAFCTDAFNVKGKYDLVYIDTPYISSKGVGVDYLEFYHFLEGLVKYNEWETLIDWKSKHLRIKHGKSIWNDKNKIYQAFDTLFKKFADSILVVSYRSDGIPSDADLMSLLKKYKAKVIELNRKKYKYVLSNNGESQELLFVAA